MKEPTGMRRPSLGFAIQKNAKSKSDVNLIFYFVKSNFKLEDLVVR